MIFIKRIFLFTCIAITIANCTKLDTTTVGQDLIPTIDNVNTFASDTFSLTTENFIFNDSSRLFKGDDVFVGSLPSNPNFGSTKATLYTQFQPLTRFNWRAPKDSISQMTNNGYDSSFLCLGLASTVLDGGIYGDSMINTTFNVYEIDNTNTTFKSDSAYRITTDPLINKTGLLGSLTIAPKDIKNLKRFYLKNIKDSTTNQLRIKFNTGAGQAYAKRMLKNDSSSSSSPADAFSTPDKYKKEFKGFYIEAVNGQSVMRFTLANNTNSRLEVWYNYRNAGVKDTANDYFYFNPSIANPYVSASANFIQRNVAGSAMQTASTPGLDNLIYLESTPGSYAKIKLPYIKNFPNKIIHRAELIITEQSQYDPLYFSPQRIYLDVFDTSVMPKFKTLPYDFYIPQGSSGTADFGYFGGSRKLVGNGLGNTVSQYNFNITKHIQNMISHNATNFDMRLYVPYDSRYYVQSTFGYYPNDNFFNFSFPLINLPIFGRVIVGGGNKMKLKITYSNI